MKAFLLLLALPTLAQAVTFNVQWTPPADTAVFNNQADPLAGYRLYSCDGAACNPATPTTWTPLMTFPATGCTASPCAGSYSRTFAVNTTTTVNFYLTAFTANQESLASNTIARTIIQQPNTPPGPPVDLHFAFDENGVRSVAATIMSNGRVAIARTEPPIAVGQLILMEVTLDRRRHPGG